MVIVCRGNSGLEDVIGRLQHGELSITSVCLKVCAVLLLEGVRATPVYSGPQY